MGGLGLGAEDGGPPLLRRAMAEGTEVPQRAAVTVLAVEGTGFGAHQLGTSWMQVAAGQTFETDPLSAQLGTFGSTTLIASGQDHGAATWY